MLQVQPHTHSPRTHLLTHLTIDEYITSIFNKIDTTGNGSLDSGEFIAAYQLLYAGTNAPKIGTVVEGEENHFEYVRAIRYGKDEKGRYIYELYMGEVKSINIKVSLTNLGMHIYLLTYLLTHSLTYLLTHSGRVISSYSND